MSYGVPVVTYDMPWLPFIQDGRGIVTVPQGQYSLAAQEIIKLLQNTHYLTSLGQCGKDHITEVAKDDIMNNWKEFFKRINNRTIVKQGKNKLNNISIILKYLTLYQFDGRQKIVNSVKNQAKRTEDRLKKELEQNRKQLTTSQNDLKQERRKIKELTQKQQKADNQLKDIAVKLKNVSAKLTDTTTLLRNIRRGSSFKIGRILTWLPRKLTGRNW